MWFVYNKSLLIEGAQATDFSAGQRSFLDMPRGVAPAAVDSAAAGQGRLLSVATCVQQWKHGLCVCVWGANVQIRASEGMSKQSPASASK